jgi:dTDP-4-amino-4,6-dideoxygalactose transaminase
MKSAWTRRRFLAAAAVAGVGTRLLARGAGAEKPAILGGTPVRKEPFPSWPVTGETDERALLDVLRSGRWFRGDGKVVDRFEEAYAKLTGAAYCIATANGTSSLITALHAAGVEAGDEVILPPYTFIACPNAVLALNALPIFADTDPETFQIDPARIEAAITEHTRAIMPVHLGGSAADLDAILAIARKHRVAVIEDACQAHLAEWRGRKVGTHGDAGCFSFQASKNLNSGEGGAVLTGDRDLAGRCFAFHNNSFGRPPAAPSRTARGVNVRMTEFQAALLLSQMARLEEQAARRDENGRYLTSLLEEIPGIRPARMYEGCTRNAYHLYMFRYDKERFAGLSRASFLKALGAEGIGASSGYSPLDKEPFLEATLQSRGFRAIYSPERIARWKERNGCPRNDRLCEEGVWLYQSVLLAGRSDMEGIAEAIRKIQAHAGELARA